MKLQKTDSYAKAYVEILEIINHMGENYKKMIPSKLLKFFEDNKDLNYFYDLSKSEDDNMQIFSNETIGLLSMLEYKYWANDNEKKILNDALIENEKKYQEELRKKYNPDKLFKNKSSKVETVKKSVNMVEYNESILIKIKNWLKRIFQ